MTNDVASAFSRCSKKLISRMPMPRLVLSDPIPKDHNTHYGLWRAGLWRYEWLAIVCAGLAYWLLGAVWYSAVFSKAWRSAVEQHGVKLGQPNQSGMGTKLVVT